MIELRGVYYDYGNPKHVIRNITLTINHQSTVFMGPNGSGKTTLLKIISLIYKPTMGSLRINNIDPWNTTRKELEKLRKQIVYVHEKPIFFRGTIIENIIYPLQIRGLSKEEAEEKALELLSKYGLEKYANRKRNQLSAGEGQILSIIRAILANPKILVLDEPTSHLDRDKRETVTEILKEKIREGKTLIISTHDTLLATELGEKIYLLYNGEIKGMMDREDLINEIKTRLK